ncbi:MAG TPA: YceI family protein [Microlunatus sp.]|nr:YceI family protein [Microlunatus sp.]
MTTTVSTPTALIGDYQLDVAHTTLGFVARHAMVTKVRGRFTEFEGTVHIDENLAGSTVNVVIKVGSIDTRQEARDAHLRSNDFLAIDQYPEITFRSTDVARSTDDAVTITGDLTIRGVTKPVTFDLEYTGSATDPFGNHRVGFEGSTVINRKDWGVNWNAALETGGVLVSEKVMLEFDVSAIKLS